MATDPIQERVVEDLVFPEDKRKEVPFHPGLPVLAPGASTIQDVSSKVNYDRDSVSRELGIQAISREDNVQALADKALVIQEISGVAGK